LSAHAAPHQPAFCDRRGNLPAAGTGHARPRVPIHFRPPAGKGAHMTVARITEISCVSSQSFQDAIVQGVERANKTLKNVKGAWVKDQEVTIDNGKVTGYKVVLKVTFILQD
jgi:flavin-binding protein dodecin